MRALVLLSVALLSSCSAFRPLEERILERPERYVGVINALAAAAESGDTVAASIVGAIAPPPDTVAYAVVDTVEAIRYDTITVAQVDTVVMRDTARYDTQRVVVDTTISFAGGRGSVHVRATRDSAGIGVEAHVKAMPVVTKTVTRTVLRDSVVYIPRTRYVAIRAPARRQPWRGYAVAFALGLLSAWVLRRKR